MGQTAHGDCGALADTNGMGLFANLRKNKSEYDGSDDWLFELQEDVDPSELAALGLPSSPAQAYEAFDVAAASAPVMPTLRDVPPPSPLIPSPPMAESGAPGLGGWHLPDVENDRRASEPVGSFELSYEITEPGPVAFAEPEPPSYEPIDFAYSPAAGPAPAPPSWADAPPPPLAPPSPAAPPTPPAAWARETPRHQPAGLEVEEFDVAGFVELAQPAAGWNAAVWEDTVWEEPVFEEPVFEEPGWGGAGSEHSAGDHETWAPTTEPTVGFRSSISEAWEPYVLGVQSEHVHPSAVDGPTAPEATVLLEILGLFPGATWTEVREAHRELIDGHRAEPFTDEAQAELADEIRREMNSAYAALRLLAVSY